MTRIISTDVDNSSDRTVDGGIQPSGPHGAVTQYTSGAEIIPFPSRFLPDSRAKSREPSIQVREFATCVFIGIFAGLVLVLFGLGFIGYRALVA
jgi:hypothetical protein